MERADLPTGPIAIVRFLFRLRNGVGSEVRRLGTVMEDLRTELAASEELESPELESLDAAESAAELDRGPASDPPA